MCRSICLFTLVLLLSIQATTKAQSPRVEEYAVHPDSLQKPGVPEGTVSQGTWKDSKVFPGTVRDYWVYVPKQYDGSKPAALMVFQDGGGYVKRNGGANVPNVFDNLINSGEMPVTIGLFINPGVVPAKTEESQARFNRSFEYDSVDDRYSRFLIEEFIPMIEKEHRLKLSTDPNDRGICGSSSGGICAFNVAWQRPDVFRRVFTTVGTYVGLRGGHELSSLIRKIEPKPLRIYLQDGSNDNNIYGGDWWMANQAMLRSLEFCGYEVEHAWGNGAHSGKHGAAIFPDVMRWLWKDHGKVPVTTHLDKSKSEAKKFLIEGADWELVSSGHMWAEGLAIAEDGTLYFTDVPASKLYSISPDAKQALLVEDTGAANGIALGPDGKLYGASSKAKQIRAWDLKTMQMEVVAEGTNSNDIVVRHDGTIYYTDPAAGKIWMIDGKTRQRREVDNFRDCNGITLSADQTQLFVAHFPGRFIYAFSIANDGSLENKQPYFHMEIPPNDPSGRLDGMCVSTDGWLVSATEAGVQICDQPGRVHLIMPLPYGSNRPCYARFGGPENKTLYVANVDKIWKRKTQLTGAKPYQPPVKPPKPQL
ncbi:MAG TPA: SMP-30/gluconolactonase/LRE family protein [Pirellula sp.]|nr:SMP-30/gluconolactonase/LRE family protein [Pirellula sp.]